MKKKAPNIVTISILTLITILLWIGASVWKLVVEETEIIVEEEILQPIDPTLDIQTLNSLNSKLYISPSQVSELVSQVEIIAEEEDELAKTPFPTEEPKDKNSEETL